MNNSYQKDVQFIAHIHTIQLSAKAATLDEEQIRSKPYVKDFFIRENRPRFVINPAKFGAEIDCAADLESVINCIIADLSLQDFDVRLDQMHVALDTNVSFDKINKINCYVKELFALSIKSNNCFRSTGDDLRKRNTIVISREHCVGNL